jgi:hypothetical protein
MNKPRKTLQFTIAQLYFTVLCFIEQVPLQISQSSYRLFINDGINYDQNVNLIPVDRKIVSCFIQTDKATYKPGQKGRYHKLLCSAIKLMQKE